MKDKPFKLGRGVVGDTLPRPDDELTITFKRRHWEAICNAHDAAIRGIENILDKGANFRSLQHLDDEVLPMLSDAQSYSKREMVETRGPWHPEHPKYRPIGNRPTDSPFHPDNLNLYHPDA